MQLAFAVCSSPGETIMSDDRAGQFSLRDLFAATAVIGLLCLIVPNLLVTRGNPGPGGRRNTCQSNQHNISLAIMMYAEAHGHYPGYANNVASRTTGYLVPILPYMEKTDVYNAWCEPDPVKHQRSLVYMNVLICPSNPPSNVGTGTPIAYVINAGQADAPDDATVSMLEANGLAGDQTLASPVLVSPDYVAAHDGLHVTLLTSENLQATSWALTDVDQLHDGTTFLWWNRPPSNTKDYRINQGRSASIAGREPIYCRPSSNHPGGVVVSFCGGNVRFIAEDIDYNVYKQLMTPNGAASGDADNLPITGNEY
jgi:hypothetical protein